MNYDVSGSARENHELHFEEFHASVSVDDDGSIWVGFHESSKCAFSLSWEDLSRVVGFVETHGQVTLASVPPDRKGSQ